jgi:hypothetical protein
MKALAFLAFVLLALPVIAQDKPAAVAKPEAVKEAAKPTPTKSAASRKAGRRWNEDARHCLEKPSNTEVIKCAEEYL